ncbi:unnamed protein product [Mytilus edulis]|uniref:Uncharacterized protein n=1 Tax=Mytilus edulis TaxID=6550 RepID=A0A8S3SIG3_MYTED|nr:unnamed protein product [Mytilus edulis]
MSAVFVTHILSHLVQENKLGNTCTVKVNYKNRPEQCPCNICQRKVHYGKTTFEFQGSSGTKEPVNEDQQSTSPEKNLEQVNQKPSTCKRKLFESEISNTETVSSRKKTPFDLAVQLLGPSTDVDDCIKYKALKMKHPTHKSFISNFNQSFSRLQIEVSKKYHFLKDIIQNNEGKENLDNLLADKRIAQKLLDHWGLYHY